MTFHSIVGQRKVALDLSPGEHPAFDLLVPVFQGRSGDRAGLCFPGCVGRYLFGVDDYDVVDGPEAVGDGGVFFIDKILMLVFEDELVGTVRLKVEVDHAKLRIVYFY